LGLRVEGLTELHDIKAALAKRWTDRRTGVGFTRWHLQLDKAYDFLRHEWLLAKRLSLDVPSEPAIYADPYSHSSYGMAARPVVSFFDEGSLILLLSTPDAADVRSGLLPDYCPGTAR
jgi:hypothetical protein